MQRNASKPDEGIVNVTVQGVQLNNANMVQSTALETQLLMVLELLADHSGQFEVTKKAIAALERNVTVLQSTVKETKDELEKTNEEVARVDKNVEQVETRLKASIHDVKQDVDRVAAVTKQLSERITALSDDLQPRLKKVEEDFLNFQSDLDEKFADVYQLVEENKKDTEEKIEVLDTRQKAARAQLIELERRFNEADIDGLRVLVNDLEAKTQIVIQRMDEGEKRTKALEEYTQDLNGQIKNVRNDLKHQVEVLLPKTYATREQFEELAKKMNEVVTKKELEEKLDDLHALINTFVFSELGKQRQEIYHKITVVQERLTSEIEEVARGEEIQMCVDRVQQFVHDIEDIGVAVAQHNDAIESAANQLASMGNEFEEQVDDLREGCRDLNVQVEGIMEGMSAEVTKVVQSMEQAFVSKATEVAVAKATEVATGIAKELISKIPAGGGGGDGGKKGGAKADGRKGNREHKVPDKEGKAVRPTSAHSSSSTHSVAAEAIEDFNLGSLAETAPQEERALEVGSDKTSARPKTSEGISRVQSSVSRVASGTSQSGHQRTVSATIELPKVSPETSTEHLDAVGASDTDYSARGGAGESNLDSQAVAKAAAAASKQEADKVKGQLLTALEGVQKTLKAQMQQLQQRIMKEIMPKSAIDSQFDGLAKRFADVEWNILRPNPEVLDMNYRKKMKMAEMMDPLGPFLSEQRHPGYAIRDEALLAKNDPFESSAFQTERPRGFIKTTGDCVPVNVFESKEMRTAYQQGRELRTRGSFQALRIFGNKHEKYNSLMSPSMERLLAEEESTLDPHAKRVATPPSRVAMLPRLDFQNPTDATHPWQMKPSHTA